MLMQMADASGCCSNFFSCTAPKFEDSSYLYVGTFDDTSATTQSETGRNIETIAPYVDPFASIIDAMITFENVALAFSGTEMSIDMVVSG